MKYYYELFTKNKNETIDLGNKIAKVLKQGDVLLLTGDLGAGKTTFTQGVANGLGITGKVISPTFNILKCYFHNPLSLYHIDAYRLEDANRDIGLEEYIEGDGVCLIEWPQYIEELIPDSYISIKITNEGDDNRKFVFESDDDSYKEIFEKIGE